jgi:hypothetical protein
MTPAILTVNPMRKRRHRRRNPESHSRRAKAARLGWRHRRHNPHRRHRRHRNPESHRERARAARAGWRHRRHNPHRRHYRRHRNPIDSIAGEVKSMLVPAGIGAVGAVGLNVALAYLPIPTSLQSGYGQILVSAAGAAGLGIIAGMIAGKRVGTAVGVGGLVVTGVQLLNQVLGPTIGGSVKGLSGLADFSDFRGAGMGAYMTPQMGRLGGPRVGAYMNPAAMLAPAAASPAQTLRAKQVAGLAAYMARSRAGG